MEVALSLLLLALRAAWPCEVECPEVPYRFAAFPDDAAPLNVRLLLGWYQAEDPAPEVRFQVLDTDEDLPGTLSSLDAERERVWFFTPDAPLDPLSDYVLSIDGYMDLITAGKEADTTAPTGGWLEQAEAHEQDRGLEGACPQGLQRSLTLRMSPGEDEGSLALYELELVDGAGAAQHFLLPRAVGWLGQGDCLDNLAWEPGERFALRSRAVDYGGNPGPWSEPLEVRTPGCATSPPRATPALALAALLLGRRRR